MNETSGFLLRSTVEAAFRQAAQDVVRVAKQTGTPVIVWKDGRVCEIPSDQLEESLTTDQTEEPDH
jgi:hypothetical protein